MEYVMQSTVFEIQKNFLDQLTKFNQNFFDASKASVKVPNSLEPQQFISQSKAVLKAQAHQVFEAQKAFHNEVISQLERVKTDYTAPYVAQYKTAVASYESITKEMLDKAFI